MDSFDFDLFVIGAGSGGVRAARIAAGYGARVAIAEEFRIGGACVIRGCVPKKLYVLASRFEDERKAAAGFGWTVGETTFDWRKLRDAKEKEISRLSGLYAANLKSAGVEIIEARACLKTPQSVTLSNGHTLSAKTILVATGGAPSFEPEIPGIEFCVTSNEIFDLPDFPRRLLVIGAGYIAVEFASIFVRLGAKVSQIFRADNILRGFDGEVRTHLAQAMRHEGVDLKPRVTLQKIERNADGLRVFLSNGEVLEVDQALLATGRKPHTKGLGLEGVGVALSPDGAIKVDQYSRTNVPSIYAVGDVTNRVNLTPVAIREGHFFADNVFGGKEAVVDHKHIATAVFTTPEIGAIGLTEEEAREAFDVVDVYTASFRPMKATLSGAAEKIFMKLLVDAESDRVIGVHLVGHDTGEMAQLLAISIRMGATKADFDATMPVHPTAAEELVTMRTRAARYIKQNSAPAKNVIA